MGLTVIVLLFLNIFDYILTLLNLNNFEEGTYIESIEVDSESPNVLNIIRKPIPNSDLELNDNTETSGKYISKIEVDGTNKHKLNITKKDLPQGFSGDYNDLTNKPTLFSGDYNDLTNKPTIPTVPTISTSITTDATDDTKTASPKAVKTYVDNVLGDIETLLEAI